MMDRCTKCNPVKPDDVPVKELSESFPLLPPDVAFDSDDGAPFVTFSFAATAEEADKEPVGWIVGKLSALMPRRVGDYLWMCCSAMPEKLPERGGCVV